MRRWRGGGASGTRRGRTRGVGCGIRSSASATSPPADAARRRSPPPSSRLLLELGERPAILSRGYARTRPGRRRGHRPRRARAARRSRPLRRRAVHARAPAPRRHRRWSRPDRYIAGRLAEHHLGATVHVLDDGFQHLQLDRDVDIVLVAAADLAGGPTLPSGRLREPADVLVAADAIVAIDDGGRAGAPWPGLPRPPADCRRGLRRPRRR